MIKAIDLGGILDSANVSLLSWTCRIIIIIHATQIKYIGKDKNECKKISTACIYKEINPISVCVCLGVFHRYLYKVYPGSIY